MRRLACLMLVLCGCSGKVTSANPFTSAARVYCRDTGTAFDNPRGEVAYVLVGDSTSVTFRADKWRLPVSKCVMEYLP